MRVGLLWLVMLCATGVARADEAPAPDDSLYDPVSPAGQAARGLYFSGMRVRYLGAARMVETLRRARLDAAVIDLKDGEGAVTYDSAIDALAPQEEVFIDDPRALVAELQAAGIYTIARIVCFTDPSLPRRDPSRGVLDGRRGHEGELWANWAGRNTWLDPFNRDNHDLIVALAREAEGFGFDEIQLDYFRFPVDEASEFAVFPADDGTPRHVMLAGLLERIDRALRIPLGVDVFGAAAYRFVEPLELGQMVEQWAPYIEVLSPMLYVNGMHSFRVSGGERRTERLVRYGVSQLRKRLGDGVVLRPFLQAFPQGADHFASGFIAQQVRGVILGEGDGYLFWHPNSDYEVVRDAMRGPVRRMLPLPAERRRARRAAALAAPGPASSSPDGPDRPSGSTSGALASGL